MSVFFLAARHRAILFSIFVLLIFIARWQINMMMIMIMNWLTIINRLDFRFQTGAGFRPRVSSASHPVLGSNTGSRLTAFFIIIFCSVIYFLRGQTGTRLRQFTRLWERHFRQSVKRKKLMVYTEEFLSQQNFVAQKMYTVSQTCDIISCNLSVANCPTIILFINITTSYGLVASFMSG